MKLTSPLGPGAGQKVAGRGGRFRQLAWASVPLWSLGFLAFAPFLYLAVVRRRMRDWSVFAAYGAVATLFITYFAGPNGGRHPAAAGGLLVLFMGIAAAHAFIVFRPGSAAATSREGHAFTSPPGPGAGQRVVDRSGRFRQLAWASVPLWSLGFLAFAPFLYVAIIRRRLRDWAVFAAYLAAFTVVMTFIFIYTGGDDGYAGGFYSLLLLLMALAAADVFVVLCPRSFPAPWRDLRAGGLVSAGPAVHAGLAFEVVEGPCAGIALAWNNAEMVLGRGAEGAELFACDPAVSQRHAIVRCGPDGVCVIEGIGSADGIVVNGARIDSPTQLRPGDDLRVGHTRLRIMSAALGPAPMVVHGAEPAVDGPSGVPREPGPSPSVPGVLRVDHVQLWQRKRFPRYEITETGWLILTETGEVRFYKRLPADMTATPDLRAPSTTEFAQEIWDGGVRAHFGDQIRSVVFTGAKSPAISAEKLEDISRIGESAASLGDSSSSQSLSLGGDLVSAAMYLLLAVRAIRARKRRLAVMRAWYPVLLGERPWPTLDVIKAWPPTSSEQALDQAKDQRDLAEAAGQLAVAIGAQWEAEAAVRSLNDLCALPARWVAADACLAGDCDVPVSLVRGGAGRASPSPPGTWATGPAELADSSNHLVTVLAQVPTGRLVVLGEPGTGKSTLMVRLVLDLLASRTSGAPVPVLASLASWNPAERDLHDWLAGQLAIDHPALTAAGSDKERPGRITALLSAGLILPILDGLDEIPEEARGPAITQINDSLRPGDQLIMTCRTGPYRDAVRSPDGAKITLQAAAVIQLCPLDSADVSRYLRAGDAGAPSRWDPVLATLGTKAPAGRALVTPLMVDLARMVYSPRPGERTADLRDPAELCRLHDQAAVEAHLLDAFIPAAYQCRPASRWDARQAESWLVFLARHLETTIGSPDLAWWQLAKAGPSARLKLAAGFAAALTAGVAAGLAAALTAGTAAGIAAGLLFGFGGALGSALVARKGNLRPFQDAARAEVVLMVGWVAVVAAGAAIFVAFGHVLGSFGKVLVAAGLLLCGWPLYFAYRHADVPGDLAEAASPRAVLARDHRATFYAALFIGFLFVILPGLVVGTILGAVLGLVPGFVFGFAFPVFIGLYVGQITGAWLSYALVRGWLALHRRLPWSLMDFLADAHQRGILRQVGSVYQFRHIELQRRLATRPDRPAAAR